MDHDWGNVFHVEDEQDPFFHGDVEPVEVLVENHGLWHQVGSLDVG